MRSDAQCTTIEQDGGGDEQLQLPGANQLILNNQLQHPGTQHKETKAQSTIDI